MKNAFLTAVFTAVFLAIAGLMTLALTGCAPVNFYSDPGLTQKTGLKYYAVRPYLQVERDQAGTVTKASVIYLPDIAHPQYIAIKDGLGSRKLDIKLTDGSITTLGISSESQLPESIEALAALVDKSAEAAKDLALKGIPSAAQNTVTELYEIIMEEGGTSVRKIEIK